MINELDDFVQNLQDQINEEARATYGDVVYKRWLNPRFMGTIDDPDGYGRVTGTCGDTMEIFLRFEKGHVKKASFQTDGCDASTVSASFATEMTLGKSPNELMDITGEVILKRIGGLPKEEGHCAFLAGNTIQEALNNYMIKQNER